MPVTNTKDLNTFIHVVCKKRGVDPENIKLMLGVDGGQGKLLCTLAIVPNNEKDKMGRMSQTNPIQGVRPLDVNQPDDGVAR